MEKAGLERVLNFLDKESLTVDVLVTDRHSQINKWIRETHPHIKHYFDVWHVAKGKGNNSKFALHAMYCTMLFTGFRKKLEASAKLKNCEIIREWLRSIVNHLYWCVASTDEDPEMIVAKWLSLENHIHNKHTRHQNKKFPRCVHKRLTASQRKKKWFKRRKVYLRLTTIYVQLSSKLLTQILSQVRRCVSY